MWPLIATLIGGFVGMKIWEKQRKTKMTPKEPANAGSFQDTEKQNVSPSVQRPQENIYADDAIVQIAERCKKGDVSAMRQMAAFFRNRCTSPLIALLDRYEADPIQENEILIRNYLRENCHEEEAVKGYMMWLVRAALYGNAQASEQLEHWPFYKQFAYIPYDMMTGEGRPYIMFWDSSFLREIGFIDIPSGYEECRLTYIAKERYFVLCYVSDYEPPDEYGFGAEWEYDYIYFDEFFNLLSARPQSS